MRLRHVVLLAIVPVLTAPARGAAESGTRSALVGDFVELEPMRTVRRDAALIELHNTTDLVLDVVVGPGSATLQPGERMFAGAQPGDVPVTVTARGEDVLPLEGDLQIEGGQRYRLSFGQGDIAVAAPSEGAADLGGVAAPTSAVEAEGARPARVETAPDERREGRRRRVDVGRRRR